MPQEYLYQLQLWLSFYPGEDNFMLELGQNGGPHVVTCLDCLVEVALDDSDRQLFKFEKNSRRPYGCRPAP